MAFSGSYGTKYESSSSPIAAFLKTRFPQREVNSIVDYETPFLNMVRKVDDLTGDGTVIPLQLDDPQGLGAALGGSTGIAQSSVTYTSGSKGAKLVVTSADLYGLLIIDGKTIMRMKDDASAFFRARERDVKGKLAQFGRDLERSMWEDSNGSAGSLGTVSSDPGTGTTFTLVTAADAINLHEGMWIGFVADAVFNTASPAFRAGGARQITKVDYESGVVTVSAAIDASVLSSGALDHVVRYADLDRADSDLTNRIIGVPTWIPSAAPSDTIFGLNRSSYSPQKVGGHRQSWLGSIEETAKKLDANMSRYNKRPKTLWLSPANFNRLDMELGARGYREEDGGQGVFGRSSLAMSAPNGMIKVKVSPYCPDGAGYLLDMETWELHTLGEVPHIVMDDGNAALRVQSLGGETLDALEIRFRAFCNLVCVNPFANGRFTIS